jgi:osmotically-inducible protein OsmY
MGLRPSIKLVSQIVGAAAMIIICSCNLLQALAGQDRQPEGGTPADDATIRERVLTQLEAEHWTRPSLINVIVRNGTVELWGIVDSASEKKAVRVAAEVTPGVRTVNDNLIIRPAASGY